MDFQNFHQLQRIYVYAFTDKQGLKEHLAFLKEVTTGTVRTSLQRPLPK